MPKGFFHESSLVRQAPQLSLAPKCGTCGIYKTCKSPKMPVHGKGRKGILIVGEAPGATEDEQNRPFCGKSGQFLRDRLKRYGINMDEDCWLTNALICHPANNRKPTPDEIGYCRPNVLKAIRELEPLVILLVGGPAVTSVIGSTWRARYRAAESLGRLYYSRSNT
jgi:uracil-DNA glycosylase family 4